jgi:hypothetical protein
MMHQEQRSAGGNFGEARIMLLFNIFYIYQDNGETDHCTTKQIIDRRINQIIHNSRYTYSLIKFCMCNIMFF